jgi:hypothetical protein
MTSYTYTYIHTHIRDAMTRMVYTQGGLDHQNVTPTSSTHDVAVTSSMVDTQRDLDHDQNATTESGTRDLTRMGASKGGCCK